MHRAIFALLLYRIVFIFLKGTATLLFLLRTVLVIAGTEFFTR